MHLNVCREVGDGHADCLQVEIDPTQQQLLRAELHQHVQAFSVLKQSCNGCTKTETHARSSVHVWVKMLRDGVPLLRLSCILANSPILMICQRSPSTKWGLPSFRSWAPMFTTWQPMAEAEFRAKFRFSCWSKNHQIISWCNNFTDQSPQWGTEWWIQS